jgi:glyoxylase-like metal-dependent hydrolase (beta-lactamase superfamily II)
MPLEDSFTDIVGKAQRGLALGDGELARRAGVTAEELTGAKSGEVDEAVIRRLAEALGLGGEALVASARGSWRPREPGTVEGLAMVTTRLGEMTVNAYVAWDEGTGEAVAFDTGADGERMVEVVRGKGLRLGMILVTHVHTDHVMAVGRLREATGARVWVSQRESLGDAERFADGKRWEVGELRIEARRTSGHARGGTTLVVGGRRRMAVVGDALFAGSMGGGMVSYEEALRTNRESIFTLPDETIVCPGHGPLTTVGEEKLHNPFFPEFQRETEAQPR